MALATTSVTPGDRPTARTVPFIPIPTPPNLPSRGNRFVGYVATTVKRAAVETRLFWNVKARRETLLAVVTFVCCAQIATACTSDLHRTWEMHTVRIACSREGSTTQWCTHQASAPRFWPSRVARHLQPNFHSLQARNRPLNTRVLLLYLMKL